MRLLGPSRLALRISSLTVRLGLMYKHLSQDEPRAMNAKRSQEEPEITRRS